MRINRWQIAGGALILVGVVLIGLALLPSRPAAQETVAPQAGGDVSTAALPTVTLAPTSTPEPLIPTATSVLPTATGRPVEATATLSATPTARPAPPVEAFEFPERELWRLGVSVPLRAPTAYDLAALRVGWVMNWNAYTAPPVPAGVQFAQTVRFKDGVLKPGAGALTAIAAANPGATWLISNEADVRWQDNVTPEVYVRLYHEAYTAIKSGDPGAVVAVGGIAQPTPLRLRYLDLILAGYQQAYGEPLPAQAWHIHNYMLREERDSWGVDIPPGLPDATGVLYEIDDSGNLELFRAQIVTFRRWMAERGYGGQPLLVSEFGIPMPEEYGFPPERMQAFLRETWRFFLTATDATLGDPVDGGRLVQRWCWFSTSMAEYPTGNLVEPDTWEWTYLGRTWAQMVGGAPD